MHSPVDKARNILVVSCEAGGAQILSSMVKSKPNKNYFFCLEGPAVDIFEGKIRKMQMVPLDFISSNRRSVDLVLTSTSFLSDFERKAIALAKKNKVKVASVLDHWIGYRERFLPMEIWKKIPVTWMNYLPDEIWVTDRCAFDIIQKEKFPMRLVSRMNNQYLDDIALTFENEAKRKRGPEILPKNDVKILYISEPVSEETRLMHRDPVHRGFSETDIVKAILQFLVSNFSLTNIKFRLRLSPNEPQDKYDDLIKGVSQIEKSTSRTLIDDLLWANTVLGVESPDLVLGLAAGKVVLIYQPETALRNSCIPYKTIMRISALDLELYNKLLELVNPPPELPMPEFPSSRSGPMERPAFPRKPNF
ncbi:MAG TPA: hypothetical protein DCZ94_08745 [Lentisphaeria bacterium]|nr:MAG: hypothetical protein A2X48_12510 [Lentisphaerae bacterium GWF2_49_21]HBC87027.1 hypothetical protein [Lentisphaeria bacterium]